jgi:ATP-binding cassette subfamily C protein CydCD
MHLDPRLLKLARQERLAVLGAVLLGVAAGVLAIGQAGALSRVLDQVFLGKKTLPEVSGLLLTLLFVLVLRALLSLGSDLVAHGAARRVKTRLRARLVNRIHEHGPAYTSGEWTGELTHVMLEGVDSLDAYYSQYLPGLVLAALVPLSILIFVLKIDLLSGLVFLLSAPIIPIFMTLIGSAAQALTRKHWRTLSRLSAYFLDVLQGLTALKTMGRSKDQVKQIARASESFRSTTMSVLRVTFLSALTVEMAATLSTAVIAVEIGLRLLYGRLSFEQAFVVLLLAPEFYLPLRMLGARYHAGIAGVEAARRIFQVLGEHAPTQPEQPAFSAAPQINPGPQENLPARSGVSPAVRFEDVHLDYEPGRPALRGVSFEIGRGEKVAVVGPSGGGKSSLAALLLRFIDPNRGEIWVDEQPLTEIPASDWRIRLAWVPQNPYLFNDTLEANLCLGKPDATRDEIAAAARLAGADEFIRDLPARWETVIGERGTRLSGGEAQRLALARAFLIDADLVILDEATANLDADTEARIQEGIARLLEGRTALVIAHRLNTIRQADRILVLDGGQIQQAGSHQELLQQAGLYRQLLSENLLEASEKPQAFETGSAVSMSGRPDTIQAAAAVEKNPLTNALQRSGSLPAWVRLLRLSSEIAGWAALSVLAGVATILSGVGLMAASAFIIAAAALHPSIAVLQVAIVGVRFFGIGRGVFRYLERLLSHQAAFKLLTRLRVSFYQALEPLAPARLVGTRSGDLLSRILGDIQTLENFYVRALAPPLTAVAALGIVFVFLSGFDARLAFVLLLFWLAAGVLAPLVAAWCGSETGRQVVVGRSALAASIVDFVQGQPDLQAFNRSRDAAQLIVKESSALLQTQHKIAGGMALQTAFSSLLAGLGMWAVLVLAIPLVEAGQIDGVYLAVIVLAALASFEAVTPLPLAARTLSSDLQAARRLFEVVDLPPAVVDPADALMSVGSFNLQVRDLSFHYPESAPLLQGISFDLPPGKRLAVVGPSGSGKSTLANLLLRFWEVEAGSILLDGRDFREYAQEAVRAAIGVVPQRTYLFSASLRDNLRIVDPRMSEAEIEQAARIAGLHEFILSLPQGYDTWVGEQGVRLSAGERQRVAIARALLKPAPLLILDEATANLDYRSEREVLTAILQSRADRSLLMITHRLVGMDAMDEILVLDKGVVIERGTHQELLAAGGAYSRTWAVQNSTLL